MKIDFLGQYGFSSASQVMREPGEGGVVGRIPGQAASVPGEGGVFSRRLVAKIGDPGPGEGGNPKA